MKDTRARIVIAGASGFIGTALRRALEHSGYTVTTLQRGKGQTTWDPSTKQLDERILAHAQAVICLSGANLVGHPWTPSYKNTLLQSRVDSVETLTRAMGCLAETERPHTFICSSAVGIYGAQRADDILTESSHQGKDFLARLCAQWENATAPAQHLGIRTVNMRTGLVMSPQGGMLKKMLPAYTLGLGAQLGDGQQWMPLISLEDCVRGFIHALNTAKVSGAVNLCAPNPIRNAEFHRTLAQHLNRPACVRIPRWLLHYGGGEFARQTLLASQRALPQVLLDTGFTFNAPDFPTILTESMPST